MKSWITLLLLIGSVPVFAGSNAGLIYQGRVVKPDGSALTDSSVTFQVKLIGKSSLLGNGNSGTDSCTLYSESHTLDMSDSAGVFEIKIGEGSSASFGTGVTTLSRLFINPPSDLTAPASTSYAIPTVSCTSGQTNYLPNSSTQDREVEVTLITSSATLALTPMVVRSVPWALQANEISGYKAGDILKVASSSSSSFRTITSGQATYLIGLLDQTNDVMDAQNKKIRNVATPLAGDTDAAVNVAYVTAAMAAAGAGTVTSVGLSTPNIFTVSAGPVTGAGTLSFTLNSQNTGLIFAAPAASAGTPSFRALAATDIPALAYVTSVATGTGLTGGPITGAGTISLANIASNSLLANTSGGAAAPLATTLTQMMDFSFSSTQGSLLYRNGTDWVALAPGTSGHYLQTQGAAANPQWAAVAASGSVTSVNMTVPSIFSVSGAPITGAGTMAVSLANQNANLVFAAATSGGAAAPTFRALVAADLPAAPYDSTYFKQGGNSFGATAVLGAADNNAVAFNTNNVERMRILAGGNVGIGTTSPAATFHAYNSASGGVAAIFETNNGYTSAKSISIRSGGTEFGFLSATQFYLSDQNGAGAGAGNSITVRGVSVGPNIYGYGYNGDRIGVLGYSGGGTGNGAGVVGTSPLNPGVVAETTGTTNAALVASSRSITTGTLVSYEHLTSAFSGTGLKMNFGQGTGSFTGNFEDYQVNGSSKFKVDYTGKVTIANTYSFPVVDGTSGQVLATNGSGAVAWTTVGSGASNYLDASDGSPAKALYVDAAGYVGIGTTAPATSLDVYGTISLGGLAAIRYPSSDSTVGNSIAIGSGALTNQSTSSAYNNIAIGKDALKGGAMTTAATNNIAIGVNTLKAVTTGNGNVAIGGDDDYGRTPLIANTTGSSNTAVGAGAAGSVTTGGGNTAIGHWAMVYNTTGVANTYVGDGAGLYSTAGRDTGIGAGALQNSASGNGYNTAVGSLSLRNATGGQNVALGYNSGAKLTTGAGNILIGWGPGSTTVTSGSNNILIGGTAVDTPAAGTSNYMSIANVLFGDLSNGRIGVGTSSLTYKLEVAGDVNVTGNFKINGTNISSGSVSSVELSAPNIFTVSGSPITGAGTLTMTLASQNTGLVFAAPSGAAGTPTFRALVAADLPGNYFLDAADGSPAKAVYVDNSGFVGVGTTAPASLLEIQNAGATARMGIFNASAQQVFGMGATGASTWTARADGAYMLNVDAGTNNIGFGYFLANRGLNIPFTMENQNTSGTVDFRMRTGSADLYQRFSMLATDSGRLDFIGETSLNIMSLMSSTGRVGIATSTPSYLLSIGGDASGTVGMERHTTADTAGNSLTVLAGGATSGATDKTGGDLVLSSGTATGTGSSNIYLQTAAAGTTGTANRSPSTVVAITGGGNVGIGTTSPQVKLDVAGAIKSTIVNEGSPATNGFNWASANVQYTTAPCAGATWAFTNLLEGTTYSLVVQPGSAHTGTCSFSQAGLTFKYTPTNAAPSASTHVIYSIMRVGSFVYVSWIDGL